MSAEQKAGAWAGDAAALERSHIIDARYPLSGASAWRPHGFALCSAVLDRFREAFAEAGYEHLGLPSAVPLELMERQAGSIKGFLDRLFLLRPSGAANAAQHVLASTIEAQISDVMAGWLKQGLHPPFRVCTIRTVGRHERNGMRSLWKERFVWPFFEAHAALDGSGEADLEFMMSGPMRVCEEIGLPTVPVERLREPGTAAAYADRRLELVTLFPDGTTTVLTSVYALGHRFSEVFDVRVGDRPLDMVNFAFSARLVLALLVHAHENGYPVYHPAVAPVQVAVVPERREAFDAALRLAADWNEAGIRADVFDDPKGLNARVEQARLHGAPLLCTVPADLAACVDGQALPDGDGAVEVLRTALAKVGAQLVADRRARLDESRLRAADLESGWAAEGLVRIALCEADACVGAALAGPRDVIGRPWRDEAASLPCGHCGAPTARGVLLGTKFRGDK